MELSEAVSTDVAVLSEALDQPGADLAAMLAELGRDTRIAVPSLLGLTVQVGAAEGGIVPAFGLTAMDGPFAVGPGAVGASLLIDLAPTVAVIFYAELPGAFVDLAADLAWLTGTILADQVIDEHLSGPPVGVTATPVRAASMVNQAIGVLIARGRTPENAHRELGAAASATGTQLHEAAAELLRRTL